MVSPKYFQELLSKKGVSTRIWKTFERGSILYVYLSNETLSYTSTDISKMSITEAKLLAYELSLVNLFN